MPPGIRRYSEWESLADPDTGRLCSSVPLDALILAERVSLDHGVLGFAWKAGFDYVKPPSKLLERFLQLKTDDAILKFAQRFGPLGLSHRGEEAMPKPLPFSLKREEQRESVKAWRRYQWEFSALLGLAAALREKESPTREAFEGFQRLGIFAAAPSVALSDIGKPWPSILEQWRTWSTNDRLRTAAEVLKARTTEFIRSCRLRPALTFETLHWPPTRVTLAFQDATADHPYSFGLSLFGALTVQLLAAATGAGFAVCSACGSVFVPRLRQPAFGKRRYCRACGRAAALRDAKADYRARLRTKKPVRRRSP